MTAKDERSRKPTEPLTIPQQWQVEKIEAQVLAEKARGATWPLCEPGS